LSKNQFYYNVFYSDKKNAITTTTTTTTTTTEMPEDFNFYVGQPPEW